MTLRVGLDNSRLQGPHSSQRVADQAALLGTPEQVPPLGHIGSLWHEEIGERHIAGELRTTLNALESPLDATFEPQPLETRRASDRSERENEAVSNRGAQQRLRRPGTSWPIELRRRCCCK